MIAVAMTMFAIVLPSAATMPMARTKSGNAMIVSVIRVTILSVQPPKKPAQAPPRLPRANEIATAETAIARSSRAATMTRLRISRPIWSVPNQCRHVGGSSLRAVSLSSGSCGASHGPASASTTSTRERPEATSVTGLSARTCRAWRTSGLDPHTSVDQPVQEVDPEVQQHVHRRHHEHEALHRRVVRGDQRLERVGADARPREDLFDEHVGAEQEREDHAEQRDDGEQRVAERVGDEHRARCEPGG